MSTRGDSSSDKLRYRLTELKIRRETEQREKYKCGIKHFQLVRSPRNTCVRVPLNCTTTGIFVKKFLDVRRDSKGKDVSEFIPSHDSQVIQWSRCRKPARDWIVCNDVKQVLDRVIFEPMIRELNV